MSAHAITEQVAATLGEIVKDSLWTSSQDETVVSLQVKQMADGSGLWAVFTSTLDADGREHEYRTVLLADGSYDATEIGR